MQTKVCERCRAEDDKLYVVFGDTQICWRCLKLEMIQDILDARKETMSDYYRAMQAVTGI